MVALAKDVPLHRLFRYPGADWNALPLEYRTGRVDPPQDQRGAFGVLYLGDSLVTAAFECRIITFAKDSAGEGVYEVVEDLPDPVPPPLPGPPVAPPLARPPYKEVLHTTRSTMGSVDLESPLLRDHFDIDLARPLGRIGRWRDLSLQVYQLLVALRAGNFYFWAGTRTGPGSSPPPWTVGLALRRALLRGPALLRRAPSAPGSA